MRKCFSKKTRRSLFWLLAIIALWEFAARAGLVNAYILPPFSVVAFNLAHELAEGNLFLQTMNSLLVIFEGFGISFVLAIIITAICVSSASMESLFNTLSTMMNPLPSVAVMPLIIMWFGIDMTAMLVIIIHGVLWALVKHLIDGLHTVAKIQLEWGRNIGLSPWQMFGGILIFAIMPDLLAGFRIAWGRAWRALISAEMVFGMIGNIGGVGYYIYINRAYAKTANVLSGLIVIMIIGILLESVLFRQIEKHTIQKWGMAHD
jgi:NitT/TauT family transport system permease protein